MTGASTNPSGSDEPYPEALLANAYRALLSNESFDPLLRQVAAVARALTNCTAVVLTGLDDVGPVLAGPWSSTEVDQPTDGPVERPSLAMPVVTDGVATHVLNFYKHAADQRFSASQLEHARRLADIAGLVISGASLGGRLDRLARIDDETGVLLRQGFEEDVVAALDEHEGHVGLVIVRVSDLEQINRAWGRGVGDEVLRLVARAIRDAIGHAGTVGRLRRHEFGALLPGSDFAATEEIAALTRELLANPLPVLGRSDVHAATAIGAAAAQGGSANSVVPLLHAAYKALDADERGRNDEPRTSRFSL
ncbi:MAG: GGDEF domain-containing protein [Gaiellaceae bacterium]